MWATSAQPSTRSWKVTYAIGFNGRRLLVAQVAKPLDHLPFLLLGVDRHVARLPRCGRRGGLGRGCAVCLLEDRRQWLAVESWTRESEQLEDGRRQLHDLGGLGHVRGLDPRPRCGEDARHAVVPRVPV